MSSIKWKGQVACDWCNTFEDTTLEAKMNDDGQSLRSIQTVTPVGWTVKNTAVYSGNGNLIPQVELLCGQCSVLS